MKEPVSQPVRTPRAGGPEALLRRIVQPVTAQLRQGISPEKIALTIALGVALGVFPLLGSTTLLCFLAALALRLNQPVIQAANYLVYPLQIPLMYFFIRTGERLFGAPHVSFRIADLVRGIQQDPAMFLRRFGMTALHGIGGWACVAVPLLAAAYLTALSLLRKISRDGETVDAASLPDDPAAAENVFAGTISTPGRPPA